MYRSIKLLETENIDHTQSIKLLKQWACYAFYVIVERVGDFTFWIMPLSSIYYLSKLILFIWIIQSWDNVDFFYKKLVSPLYYQYHEKIEDICYIMTSIINRYKEDCYGCIKINYDEIKEHLKDYISKKHLFREKE